MPCRMESGQLLQVQYVLFVSKLKFNVLSILLIKAKGFEMNFQDGKVRLRPRGFTSTRVVTGVREHGLCRLTGKPIFHEKKK